MDRQAEARQVLSHCFHLGVSALRSSISAIDVAELVGVEIVDTNYFITAENKQRLEQAKKANSIQFGYRLPVAENGDGNPQEIGSLSTAKTLENGISLAEYPLQNELASSQEGHGNGVLSVEACAENKEKKPYRNKILHELQMNGVPISIYEPETAGCVVVDSEGHCAAATSTGGLINKMVGRIGDSPILGAGTDTHGLCAVSATGEGEAIVRATVARDVAALMEYKGLSLQQSLDFVINEHLEDGKGGLVAVSSNGEVAVGFNTVGMFRACATGRGYFELGIWH